MLLDCLVLWEGKDKTVCLKLQRFLERSQSVVLCCALHLSEMCALWFGEDVNNLEKPSSPTHRLGGKKKKSHH